MTNILGAVNDFILAYVQNADVSALQQSQVVRGWQNVVSALPKDTQEYAVLTLLQTVRHGTNVHEYTDTEAESGLVFTTSRLAEHMVQVDFCSAYPAQTEENARIRADLLEMFTRDRLAADFYADYGFSACYADDVRALPFQNEASQWIARYSVTLHLSGWTAAEAEIDSFSNVKIERIENVDVHHPVSKGD